MSASWILDRSRDVLLPGTDRSEGKNEENDSILDGPLDQWDCSSAHVVGRALGGFNLSSYTEGRIDRTFPLRDSLHTGCGVSTAGRSERVNKRRLLPWAIIPNKSVDHGFQALLFKERMKDMHVAYITLVVHVYRIGIRVQRPNCI
jgi:hypothetical protein